MRIGIIGPNGAGKSLLSKKLSEYYHCALVKEPVETNPYLPYFYNDKDTFSFLAQNAFYSALFLLMWQTKDEKNVIYDSTLFSNLVYTELLRLEGYMSAMQVALTYAIADEHLKKMPPLDFEIVIVRKKDTIFKNIAKRGRAIEKGQEDYLNFHYDHYYTVIKGIYKNYHFPAKKTLFLEIGDMEQPEEFASIIKAIEAKFEESKK